VLVVNAARNLSYDILQRVGSQIESLSVLDTHGTGVAPRLAAAARNVAQGPAALIGALRLQEIVEPGDAILIATGFPSRSFLRGGITETDGPVGAAVLGRAIEQCLHAVPIFLAEPRLTHYLESCAVASGLLVADLDRALGSKRGQPQAAACAVIPFPAEDAEAMSSARALLGRTRPAAVVSIELPGRNTDGRYHTAKGREIDGSFVMKADTLFAEAQQRTILSIGIGDNGNEVGMGSIRDEILSLSLIAERYAAATAADILITATNSNWGAYALAACLALVTGDTELLSSIDIVRIIQVCAQDGAIDGISSRPEPRVDGTTAEMNAWIVALMHAIVEAALGQVEKQ
jgi:D-glutamate cyclase